MARKNTDVAHRQHVEKVAELLLNFWSRWQILQYAQETWSLKHDMADRLIREATALITETISDWDEELKKHLSRGHSIIKKALEAGDLKTATTMFSNLSKIGGMERQSLDVTSGGMPLISFGYQVLPELPASTNATTIDITPTEPLTVQALIPDTSGPDRTDARPKRKKRPKTSTA